MRAGSGRALAIAVLAALISASHLFIVRPWFAGWGATEQERASVWPGDELSPNADTVVTRAITIRAPTAEVWPWIAQVGQDRAGWYSYRLLENIVGSRMPRVDTIVPSFQDRRAGDNVWMYPPERAGGVGHAILARIEPQRAFVMRTATSGSAPTADGLGNSWSAILEPIDNHTTRLIMRSRGTDAPGWWSPAFGRLVFDPIHFTMERKMMATIAALAEGRRPGEAPDLVQAGLWLAFGVLAVVALIQVVFSADWVPPFLVVTASAIAVPISLFLQPHPAVTALLYAAAGGLPKIWQKTRHGTCPLYPVSIQ